MAITETDYNAQNKIPAELQAKSIHSILLGINNSTLKQLTFASKSVLSRRAPFLNVNINTWN